MAILAPQDTTLTGLALSTSAAANGDKFANPDGKRVVQVTNGGGSSITVTVAAVTACNHGTMHDSVATIAAGATKLIGPFPVNRFTDVSGYTGLAYSALTSVTVAVIDPS